MGKELHAGTAVVTFIAEDLTTDRASAQRARIAYFSMEIALRNEMPTFSGGLGVLAGHILRSAADLDLPLVAVSLVSRRGSKEPVILLDTTLPENDEADREPTDCLHGGELAYRLRQEIIRGSAACACCKRSNGSPGNSPSTWHHPALYEPSGPHEAEIDRPKRRPQEDAKCAMRQ